MERQHGTRTRGIESVPFGPFYEGRFGRMFAKLPTFRQDEDALRLLADTMVEAGPDDHDNLAIPAGYTYLGQFIGYYCVVPG